MNTLIIEQFIKAASVFREGYHAAGTLDEAANMLAADPSIGKENIFTAVIVADVNAVQHFISIDKTSAVTKGGPYNWDPLTYLCFSRFLQFDASRSDDFVRCGEILLNAGADANTGWWENDHQPEPEWEPVLYGACGLAHHPGMTKLLLDRGADPNDIEVVYHSPETSDNRAMEILMDTGKLTDESLILMLIRKHDWHDHDGAKMILATGVDPNITWRDRTPLLHSIQRDNHEHMIRLLLEHKADPTLTIKNVSGFSLAARRGRGDLLKMFTEFGFAMQLPGVEKLIAACALNDEFAINAIKENEPALVNELLAEGGKLLAEFAGTNNSDGVNQLLKLGIPVTALYSGDPYFGIPANSTALHVAAWKAWHRTVKLLIENKAPVNITDGYGKSPLFLAVRACTDSYWSYRRTTESIKALLDAGATTEGIQIPTGYEEADYLLTGTK